MISELFSKDAEMALIGSILIAPEKLSGLNILSDDFYIHRHRMIWSAAQELNGKLDYVTLMETLEKNGDLADVGGAAYLTRLINMPPSSESAKNYQEIIVDFARRRIDLQIASEIAQGAHSKEGLDRASIIDSLSRNEKIKGETKHISNAAKSFYSEVETKAKDPHSMWGMETGFIELDKLTGGLQKQQSVIIAGAPEAGKSLLAAQIAKQVAENGHTVVYYSFEMSANRLFARLVSAESGVPTRAMNTGFMEGHWDKFNKGLESLEDLPIYISDVSGMTTASLRSDVARMKALHGVDLIVLDYLNLLLDSDGSNDTENTALKSRRFRAICREFDVAGITIQSMTKEGMDTLIPKLTGISGPASIAFDADVIFLMTKHPEEKNVARLLPAKLRDGDVARKPIDLAWVKGLPKFGSLSRHPEVEH